MIECEKCPVRNYCEAYESANEDNRTSYHPQTVVRVSNWDKPACPLLAIVSNTKKEKK